MKRGRKLSEKSNLQVLCHECNHGKGNWDQTDWRPESNRFSDEDDEKALAALAWRIQ